MRLKPKVWYLVSLLFFVAAIFMWRYADKYAATHRAPATSTTSAKLQHPPLVNTVATNTTKAIAKRKTYRLSNTRQSIAQLLHNRHAIILRNALIDTEIPIALDIPAHLKAKGAPGSYLVQSDRPLDKDFYEELNKAGATYISYVPNDTALVKATPDVATNLAAQADIIAVLPYEPYYKLDSTLLPSAVEQEPQSNALSVVTFPGQRDAALSALTHLGAKVIGEDSSPFGPTLVVRVPPESLVAVAQLPLAQEIESYSPRKTMNDLTRVIMNESTNTLTNTPNYMNLTGSNVTVNVNDTGVDASHPDFAPSGRIFGATTDGDGHGTHVAGIIAGNGSQSGSLSIVPPGSVLGADFRGKAKNATIYSQAIDIYYTPFISDVSLQQRASTNLGSTNLISNNSWDYNTESYDVHAASYDAATRDAQPNLAGEQPLLFIFSAGNNGQNQGTINSPGTAKNVITVGASDLPRFITNEVYTTTQTNNTSQLFYFDTSSSNLVASFSGAGNVGVGVDGFFGRFKPDVVAPGTFVISCRSSNYVDPTVDSIFFDNFYPGQALQVNQTNHYSQYLPANPNGFSASGVTVLISSNAISPEPFPTNMILVAGTTYPPTVEVSSNFYPGNPYFLTNFNPGDFWNFGVADPSNQLGPINYNLDIYLFETNYEGDYFQVLSNLNYPLRKYYRYASGTSMSAAAVSGTLALMQEFLQTKLSITNPSPALLKAMLINGSRSLGSQYDFDVDSLGANVQGWGLPNLSNSIPPGLASGTPSIMLIDQSTNRALATGQYQTYKISSLDTNASGSFPLRLSLVWTDPPGDPAAGIALVNNLEMTAVDATGTNVFVANNFGAGEIFTSVNSTTNMPGGSNDNDFQNVFVDNTGTLNFTSAGDTVNNVQNIYIDTATTPITFPLTVTISGTRVNVNAVTTQTNNILQDYALVISSDDTGLTQPLTVTSNIIASANPTLITIASNGVPLLHQRVGANEPNLYNFTLSDTNGNLGQWHFFIFSNLNVLSSNLTNVAFATFLPPNLSIPRASGTADIDLYVLPEMTEIPNFTNYITNAANFASFTENAIKSVGRTGTETVIFTNATYPFYYIGVKSEDQQASDFGFYGIAQSNPFSSASADGNTITATATSLPVFIPNSLSPTPALAFAFLVNPNPALQYIRRVVVTDGVSINTPGSLYGTLQHTGVNVVLNAFSSTTSNPGFTNTYDDLQENPTAGDVLSDGPGHLTQFVNQSADGLWLMAQANDDQFQTGYLTTFNVSVDLQQPQTVGFLVTIPGQSWFDDYIQVPNDATNMTIFALYESQSGGPIGIFETNEIGEIFTTDYGTTNPIVAPGGSLSLGTNSPVPGWPAGTPPLAGGYWYYGIYNYGTAPVTLFVQIQIEESLTPNLVTSYTNTDFIPLTTDGHTQSQICVNNGQQLVDLQVGLRLDDTNLDDLVIHLTSPQGTSVLLFEDRGGTNATNLGMSLVTTNITTGTNGAITNYLTNFVYTVFTEDTNLASVPIKFAPPPYATNIIVSNITLSSNSFETLTNGIYTNGAVLEGWLVTNNYTSVMTTNGLGVLTNYEVGIVTDSNGESLGGTNDLLGTNYLALTSARIIQTFAPTNSTNVTFAPITNGQPYELVFYAKPLGITHWYPGNGSPVDVIGTNNGTISNIVVTNFYTNGAIVTSNIEITPLVEYGVGEVAQAFKFTGTGTTPTNEVDFGTNVGNFGTNDFTVDFWIQEPAGPPVNYGVMEKRTACDYNTNMWTVTSANGLLSFEISGDTNLYDTVLTPTNLVADGQFHHAAITRQGAMLSFYIDGLLATNYATNGIVNITNTNMFRAGQTMCVGSGAEPFIGELDELDLYDRALSPAEVFAIYHAGSLGKATTNSLLPNFSLTLDNIATNTIIFTNASGDWQLFTNSFIATNDSVTVEFSGNAMGVLLDQIQLIQLPTTNYDNYYLPEEPISPFVGENPLGCWTLDVWDTRTDSPLPTNGTLLSWTLQMTTSSTNATLYVLTNGDPITITNLTSNNIAYFAVDVPFYATYATNLLTALTNGPLTLYFDQNALPTGGLPGDVTLQTSVNPPTIANSTLATLGTPPPLLPGRRYFLGVENNGTLPASFKIEVDFNGGTNLIIPLTNQSPYTNIVGTNLLGTNDPEYYSFTVPTNVVLVTFQILNATNGEVDLYARQGLPVPSPLRFDYESVNAGSNDQFIAVTTNSIPVSLQPVNSTNLLAPAVPTTWYLAAYNPVGVSNIQYTIVASYVTNGFLNIIPLTNAIPYTNTASPGYPTNLMYSFTVTNSPSGIIFTVTNLTNAGNVQLLADLDSFPTPQQSYAGSLNPGTNSQFIEVIPNENLPSLNGTWYLVVPNTSILNVPYTIEAITNIGPPNVAITWSGRYNDLWDILTTSNWVETTNVSTGYVYQNGANVTFNDSAVGPTTVDLTASLAPASITVNDTNLFYTFFGTGSIVSGPLATAGPNIGQPSLTLNNTGSNSFSSISLGDAILQVGNNDAAGSIGISAPVDTGSAGDGMLVFDRTDTLFVPNAISDNGSVSQIGTGTLILAGTNSYSGGTTISNGTVVVDNINALGNGFIVNIDDGTLDFGGIPIAYGPTNSLFDGETFSTAGAGVGGQGAIVNNGPLPQLAGIEAISLQDDTTIGGNSRWDIRPGLAQAGGFASLVLGDDVLTKTGPNQINITATSVSRGSIIIHEGILSFEGSNSFINVNEITVDSGGLLGQILNPLETFTFNIFPAPIPVPITLNGGGITNMSGGGTTYMDGTIDLATNSFIANEGGIDIFDSVISDTGSITNLGFGTNLFAATNTYTGATYVLQGTLGFTNGGSIANSSSIMVFPGATLDSTENTAAGQTLILGTNQTLIDNGTVLGMAVVAKGGVTIYGNGLIESNLYMFTNSIISPGPDGVTIGTFTVAGTALLGGTNVMKINKLLSPGQTNDLLIASNFIGGGVLVVTNYGPTNSFAPGDSFTLFSSATPSALSFSTIILPPLTNGLYWQNTFASGGGSIYISTNATAPAVSARLAITLSGNQLVLNGSLGTPGSQYEVLTSTNLSLPFSNWTSLTTNIFDTNGDFSFTNPSPTNAAQFFLIQSP